MKWFCVLSSDTIGINDCWHSYRLHVPGKPVVHLCSDQLSGPCLKLQSRAQHITKVVLRIASIMLLRQAWIDKTGSGDERIAQDTPKSPVASQDESLFIICRVLHGPISIEMSSLRSISLSPQRALAVEHDPWHTLRICISLRSSSSWA